ncbi:unnamed protein product [Fusarium venenatum]|uniref:Uncharacterized protein n=1 Tax=Fusarium venenatum TaxID=56646 RepID=A0A2L2T7Y5_9HYPO|nr:uncharacterized protein FVRRES_00465 [Fusarium venenatum]CEI63953.1 unnamed protein product [Fusarium venenatum]
MNLKYMPRNRDFGLQSKLARLQKYNPDWKHEAFCVLSHRLGMSHFEVAGGVSTQLEAHDKEHAISKA